jgi:hypothetical protein
MAGSPVAPAAGQRRIAGQFASSAADAVTGIVREDAHAGLRLGLLPRRDVVAGNGEEPTGRGFIRGGNQHLNPLDLHLRVLSSGIICRHRCAHAVTSQHAGDQLRLGATGNDRHRHRRAVHDRNSSAPGPAGTPLLAAWSHVGRPVAPMEDLDRDQSAVPRPREPPAGLGCWPIPFRNADPGIRECAKVPERCTACRVDPR